MESLIIVVLLAMMAAVVVVIAIQRNLFAVVVLTGIYSFLMATVLVALDAVDVAMTEAAVGAGMSMVLFLSALFFGEPLTWQKMAGVALIVGGVALGSQG